jgi:putative two-component system response regulator
MIDSGLGDQRPHGAPHGANYGRLLVVDDDDDVRAALARFFQTRGFAVDTADSGAQALDLVVRGRYAIAICDVRMPRMSGLELLPRLLERDADLAVLMLSALSDPSTAGESLALGAMEHLSKPIALEELQLAVERVLHRRSLARGRRARDGDNPAGTDAGASLDRPGAHVAARGEAAEGMMRLIDMFEARDPCFDGMSLRVARATEGLCRQLGLPEDLSHEITLAARLHDVGRLVVDPAILAKPGLLTPEEFEQVKQHVARGVEVLEPLLRGTRALTAVRDHHEHFDGGGYPRGISAERISIGGRILCVADTFVAVTSRRPYRDALSAADAWDILSARSGSMLDPRIVDALRPAIGTGADRGLTPT